jgi:DNA-binding Lrp family transcriptional regulator
MAGVPEKVQAAFRALTKQQKHMYLKKIRESYYVYKQTYEWQPDEKKSKTLYEYMGKILADGRFVRRISSYKDQLAKAEALIVSHGGEVTWHEKTESKEAAPTKKEISLKDSDLKLLMALSMNSRMPVPKLAELAGLNEQTTYSRLKALEEKLGIKYLLEIDVEKLGYTRYLILIKFHDEVPSREEIEEAIKDESNIQFVAMTKGDYDVVMLVVNETPLKAYDDLLRLREKESISRYEGSWIFTDFAQTYSFIPLRNQFIENIIKEKVWHRSKEAPRPERNQLRQREFLLLKELNGNSNMNFASVDQKYGLNKGTSRYAYQALKERGLIARPTISMTNLPIRYVGIILFSIMGYKVFAEKRYEHLMERIEYGKISNKYCLTGNIGAPVQGTIGFLPVTEDGYLDKITTNMEREFRGSIAKSLVITEMIIGELCYRRFDNTYSRHYRLLVELKKIEPIRPTFYG